MLRAALILFSSLVLGIHGAGIFHPTLLIIAASLSVTLAYDLIRNGTRSTTDHVYLITGLGLLVGIQLLMLFPLPSLLHGWMSADQRAAWLHLNEFYPASAYLSANRAGTLRFSLLLITALAGGCLASRLPVSQRRPVLYALLAITTVTATAGFVSQHIIPQGKDLWWMFPVTNGKTAGCFVSRNHFGGYIAIFVPIIIGVVAQMLATRKTRLLPLALACLFVLSLALFKSHSRGAWIAALTTLPVALMLGGRKGGWRTFVGLALILILITGGLTLSKNELDEQRADSLATIHNSFSGQARANTWRDSLSIIKDHPVAGVGTEGFRMVMPRYRTDTYRKHFKHAENEYVQLLTDGGFLGLIAAVLIGIPVIRNLRAGDDPLLRTAALGALSVAAVHACFDFAPHNALYSLVLAIITGLAWRTPDHAGKPSSHPWAAMAITLSAVILVTISAMHGRRVMIADSDHHIRTASAEELLQNLAWAPTSWQSWYYLGRQYLSDRTDTNDALGIECVERAAECNPNSYEIWTALYHIHLNAGNPKAASAAREQAMALRDWLNLPPVPEDKLQ